MVLANIICGSNLTFPGVPSGPGKGSWQACSSTSSPLPCHDAGGASGDGANPELAAEECADWEQEILQAALEICCHQYESDQPGHGRGAGSASLSLPLMEVPAVWRPSANGRSDRTTSSDGQPLETRVKAKEAVRKPSYGNPSLNLHVPSVSCAALAN